MNLHHQSHKEQSPLSPDQGSAFSLIPPPPPCAYPTLTAALTPTMPCTEAIGNKDNYIKQPFEIPLGFGWLELLVREMWEVWCIALPLVMDRMTSHHSGRDYVLRWTVLRSCSDVKRHWMMFSSQNWSGSNKFRVLFVTGKLNLLVKY